MEEGHKEQLDPNKEEAEKTSDLKGNGLRRVDGAIQCKKTLQFIKHDKGRIQQGNRKRL